MGSVLPWYHLVRTNTFAADERTDLAATPVQWSIWTWEQVGRRIQLHDTIVAHEPLAEMVRAEPLRPCVFSKFPLPGKRASDKTIELVVVVPPEQFARYESLVKLAMALPTGHLAITFPAPAVVNPDRHGDSKPHLISPGLSCLTEGLEMVVSRAPAKEFSTADLRSERRSAPAVHAPAKILHDDGDDWLLFAAEQPLEKQEPAEPSIDFIGE
jgi:hypothetical protein